MRFSGRHVLVAGGASGIGAAATRAFLAEGAAVSFSWLSSETEAAGLAAEAGDRCLALRADATRVAEVFALFEAAEQRFGPVDALFANAGGLVGRHRLADMPAAHWLAVVELNLTSTFLLCREALRRMEPRRRGAIVTMASLAALDGGGAGASAYAAAKGGVVALTKALAKEAGPAGIRVNAVAPGLIATRLHDRLSTAGSRAASRERTPLGREGAPEDVARVVVDLASADFAFVTGQVVTIDGGRGLG